MKKYKLKKWYPSLPEDWNEGMEVILESSSRSKAYMANFSNKYSEAIIDTSEVENNPEFWEEVEEAEEEKKLLLKSADGYEIYSGDEYYFVHDDFDIDIYRASYIDITAPKDRCFAKQENAERYRYIHKPVFSRRQILDAISESKKMYSECTIIPEIQFKNILGL